MPPRQDRSGGIIVGLATWGWVGHPVRMNLDRWAYRIQKANAKARGIPWQLEYWEWLQIWQDSGHLHERGVHGGQWVMGRNGDIGPYSAQNVKIIRHETNVSDQNKIIRARKAAERASGSRSPT